MGERVGPSGARPQKVNANVEHSISVGNNFVVGWKLGFRVPSYVAGSSLSSPGKGGIVRSEHVLTREITELDLFIELMCVM